MSNGAAGNDTATLNSNICSKSTETKRIHISIVAIVPTYPITKAVDMKTVEMILKMFIEIIS